MGILIHMQKTNPQTHNQFIGYLGETEAVRFLKEQEHTVLRRNYRNRFGEIDIISFDRHKTLCFHEVKTIVVKDRKNEETETDGVGEEHRAEDNLSRKKIGCMMRAAERYLASFPIEDPYWEAHGVIINLSEDLTCLSSEMIPHINIEVS